MTIAEAKHQTEWDSFLHAQPFSPFLQSWTMGEVYRDTGQDPIRLEIRDSSELVGICQAIVVPARRGRHLAISYGPILSPGVELQPVLDHLRSIAKDADCSFIRLSPFWPKEVPQVATLQSASQSAPLHLLAEHIWYLPLTEPNFWQNPGEENSPRTEEELLMGLRKTTRNLVRRAERDGVTIRRSEAPMEDLQHFLKLHEETRHRHKFTPYTDAFFTAQLQRFSERNECTLYLAEYEGEVIASSMHMHMGGETSYHHGASTHKYSKVPASYLLQWTAITDALKRGNHTYSFWGIAPEGSKNHPFAGVTTFKRGFGGELLEIAHCRDIPVSGKYYLTKGFETLRKWKRGF